MDFKIGDRVVVTKDFEEDWNYFKKGEMGTVVGSYMNMSLNIDWDREDSQFHDCHGLARHNHGWNIFKENFKYLKPIRKKGNLNEF